MDYAVTTDELTKAFGDFTAVDRLSISIERGEVCGFLGPNGAGKTTAIRMLCGLLDPTSGSGMVAGYDLVRETEKIKQHIGYMSQKFSLYDDLSARENLSFYARLYSIPNGERGRRIDEMIDMAGLMGREDELVANLSGGWKQRLALGCAIIARPSIVFLDEPTSGVSPTSRRSFFNIIQGLANQGTTVIVTTHFMDEAERCNRIVFINQGHLLAFDTPERLKAEVIDGYMVELELPGAVYRIEEIEALPYVKECSLHGPLLHVLLEDPSHSAPLREFIGVTPRAVHPTLEDVFIALAKKRRRVSA
ncbi:MAG: ABC transporter ATP-binding protein [Firmicutes bacterium]|nr:ABC transporter ATP-binding protein [Bacillota bacterium]